MPMRKLFITGTNTGVGKTLASALLCRELIRQGYSVGYVKPVQTGCFERNGDFIAPDEEYVKLVCGEKIKTFCPVKFKLPASPHLSAAEEGITLDPEKLIHDIESFSNSEDFDFVIIEGAGGISVPLTLEFDMAGLCKALNAEMIVVTTTALGTLNHTKLTLEYAESRDLACRVIISGCSEDPDIIAKDNIQLISKMFAGKVMFQIPEVAGLNTESSEVIKLPEVRFDEEFISRRDAESQRKSL